MTLVSADAGPHPVVQALESVRQRIVDACVSAGRPPDSVTLMAVSKTFPASAVAAAVDAGQRVFGENYVQEGVEKCLQLRQLRPEAVLQWHFIGPLQSNKSRPVAEHFDWVHSIDRLRLAQRLSDQRPADRGPLQVCIQVNISDEASKSGVPANEAVALACAVARLPRLQVRGLMTIPAPESDPHRQRAAFAALATLLKDAHAVGLRLDTLSMGMSADLESAIAEGSSMVRVGTAIFGARGLRTN